MLWTAYYSTDVFYKNLYAMLYLSSSILFGLLCIYVCVMYHIVLHAEFYVFLCTDTLSEMTNKHVQSIMCRSFLAISMILQGS